LESTNKYLGKLIEEPEVLSFGSNCEEREKFAKFKKMLNGEEIVLYVPRWENYEANKLNTFVAYD
jgi:hypothetical protein